MITKDKITDNFCTLDEFSRDFGAEVAIGFSYPLPASVAVIVKHRSLTVKIMTILIVFHFGTFANFKHYYLTISGYTRGTDM